MVATRSDNIVQKILGQEVTSPRLYSRDQWEGIVRELVKAVDLASLHGFVDAATVLSSKSSLGMKGWAVERPSMGTSTKVYLPCAFLATPSRSSTTEKRLVLDRKGRFCILTAEFDLSNIPVGRVISASEQEVADATLQWDRGFCGEPILAPDVISSLWLAQKATNEKLAERVKVGHNTEFELGRALRSIGWSTY
jgi:hypothetical protein